MVKQLFQSVGFKVTRGARYLGGFIGTKEMKDQWIQSQVDNWVQGVKAIAKIAYSQPHSAFVGLRLSLQSEWTHLQRV